MKGSYVTGITAIASVITAALVVMWLAPQLWPDIFNPIVCVEDAYGMYPNEGNTSCYCIVKNVTHVSCTNCDETEIEVGNRTDELGDVCTKWSR